MSDHLPEAVRKGLEDARVAMMRRSGRLCVHDGDRVHPVLRLWDGGFSLGARNAPVLRGHVDLYDGSRHIYSCLVLHSHEDEGERIYEFKWSTAVSDRPAADFERAEPPPAGLIARHL